MEVAIAILLTLACSLFVFLTRWSLDRREKLKLFKKLGIPGPEPNFLTGNLLQLDEGPTRNDVITKWLKEYGDVFGYFVGETPYIVIKDLEMLKQVFIKDFPAFMNRPGNPLRTSGSGQSHLLQMEGKRWKEVRSILTPTFTSGKIKFMMEIIDKKVDNAAAVVRKKAENGEMFDIHHTVQGMTLDVISDCAFAMKTNCLNNPNDKLFIAVKDASHFRNNLALLISIIFPFLKPLMVVVDRYFTKIGKLFTFLLDHLKIVINDRRNNPEAKSNDFLQLVLEANQNESTKICMTDEEIVSNSLLFLLAGYETTSTALGFTFELLIKHPDIQEKLYEEIARAEDCSYSTIQSLRYMDQVFSESLRLYPPVTGNLSRHCVQDHQVGSIMIPKGSNVFAPVWDIHHDPDLWPDPWKFDPDRFSSKNKSSIHSMAYLPFGAGPRNCIGARFGQFEAKLTLFKLLREFRFEVCEKTDDPLTLICPIKIIFPAKGIYLRAVPRS